MTLTRRAQPFSHPDWLFEIKHDGFRALPHLQAGKCQLVSRKGYVYKRCRRSVRLESSVSSFLVRRVCSRSAAFNC